MARAAALLPLPDASPASSSGCCVWLTGLSGAGKTELARVIGATLERRGRPACVLDGDDLQSLLWPELKGGCAREDRHKKSLRLAFAASLVVRFGGIAVCAIISPYSKDRLAARQAIEPFGRFFEILVDTPLQICAERDRRDFYRRARTGEIQNFTGVSDVYESTKPDLRVGNSDASVADNAHHVLGFLLMQGCL